MSGVRRVWMDVNIGGSIDGTTGADIGVIAAQVRTAERLGFDGIFSTELSRDPFLPLVIAADRSETLRLGTAAAVAFARNPMTVAVTANDLNTMSRGRFVLGLGSQVKAHVTRRFSMPWSAPAERMHEYVRALHAIWNSWNTGTKLEFEGEFYRHTLMTPMFDPRPSPYGAPQVMIAGVGPRMTAVAAEVADGLLMHSFMSARYMREVTMPVVVSGLAASSRARTDFTTSFQGLVATGTTESAFDEAVRKVRHQIAFYGSTPAYRGVLELHGWGDLHQELHRLSKSGGWETMAKLIDDDVLHTLAIVGEPAGVGREIVRRFSGLVDRFTPYTPYRLDDDALGAIVAEVKTHTGF